MTYPVAPQKATHPLLGSGIIIEAVHHKTGTWLRVKMNDDSPLHGKTLCLPAHAFNK